MPLELVKSLRDMTREELEDFLTGIQAKRVEAAVLFFETKKMKLEKVNARLADRIEKQLALLEKNILSLDKMVETIQMRMDNIEQMKQEAGVAQDSIEELLEAVKDVA